jgi:hypothetical protein
MKWDMGVIKRIAVKEEYDRKQSDHVGRTIVLPRQAREINNNGELMDYNSDLDYLRGV